MVDEAILRLGECLEVYFKMWGRVPVEPILYRLVLLVRMAVVRGEMEEESQEEV